VPHEQEIRSLGHLLPQTDIFGKTEGKSPMDFESKFDFLNPVKIDIDNHDV
jgi:hypothetical protein